MKTIKSFKIIYFAISLSILFILNSCGSQTDSKHDAVKENEAKYGNVNKEKDARFLVNAAEINLKEILLGKLAQLSGIKTQIKALGKMMEEEHTQGLEELRGLALKKEVAVPTDPTKEALDAQEQLGGGSGKDFDKEYADMMVKGHREAIALFESVSGETVDEDIKVYILATLPVLRKHLEHAEMVQKEIQ